MAVEVMDVDRKQGEEILRLWKEMSDIFVQIRDLDFKVMEDYLRFRVVDAGCPWTMAILCFSMDFLLTPQEVEQTADITYSAYDAWVLVNDYFSWEKEWKNYQDNGSKGEIASAVYLFMKWNSVDWPEGKKMLRSEILAREEKYCRAKDAFLARGIQTERTLKWLELLDLVTAGNFAWSMTTARYLNGPDSYPELRAKHESKPLDVFDPLAVPISIKAPATYNSNDTPASNRSDDMSPVEKTSSESDSFGSDTDPNTTPEERYESDNSAPFDKEPLSKKTNNKLTHLSAFEELAMQPYSYIAGMPSKGVRNSAIDGLDAWYRVPEKSLATIRNVVTMLHSASLMLDDIEDSSELRRGQPATHTVFGVAQTINSANLAMFKALQLTQSLSPAAVEIFSARIIEGHIGQGMDLAWTVQTATPTEAEYFAMVDGKTGGLFILLAELMRSEATVNKNLDVAPLMRVIGRFFQVRDDYQNLQDAKYTEQKGFADDINEGKVSLPLIYALSTPSDGNEPPKRKAARARLWNLMQQRKMGTVGLSNELRRLGVDQLKSSGALEYTKGVAMDLQKEVDGCLSRVERRLGAKNWTLRLVQKRLEID